LEGWLALIRVYNIENWNPELGNSGNLEQEAMESGSDG
jgi:hypothetical protein